MRFGTRVYCILIGSLAVLALASCGGAKSKSAGATFQVNPGKPIVISADAPKGAKTIKGPWFGFTLSMTNSTTDPITLIALEYEVAGQTDNGTTVIKGVFSPSEHDFTSDTLKCEYTSFGTWAPGETRIVGLPNGNAGCATDSTIFLSQGNPKGTFTQNYHYRVKVKPAGWFGTLDNATDRFDKTFNFSTQ